MTFSISTQSSTPSFDDSIRPVQHRLRNRHADLLGCLEVDHQLKLRWLLDRKIGRLRALEDLVDVGSSPPRQIDTARPVHDEATSFRKPAGGVNRRQLGLGY